ncbi:hypothetical protein H257_16105 [Aphanomyces astaci]|uniref:Uncharacterized protein n=1 Tax=Aphanomyces astaci TaxID=112090 RepID=W4FM19_APHAT|nr:hypothetical protein H257_16105 [Aphanomyces astaci]ETV67743.1 hypothetical protein H257_16105 [Aphanomyces astaci]|eukprot:XP_009842736.1 hypothetical protein H257_16105 [Aphanomyces astaci]
MDQILAYPPYFTHQNTATGGDMTVQLQTSQSHLAAHFHSMQQRTASLYNVVVIEMYPDVKTSVALAHTLMELMHEIYDATSVLLMDGAPLYLYLLDEATSYPIDTTPPICVKFLTTNKLVVQSGFELLKASNEVVATCRGLPGVELDTIKVMTSAETTSVEPFDVL